MDDQPPARPERDPTGRTDPSGPPATATLEIDYLRPAPGLVYLRLTGPLDGPDAGKLVSVVTATLVISSPLIVALDLARVNFCSAAGLTALLTARHHTQACGCALSIHRPSHAVRRSIEVAGLQTALL